MKRLWRWLLVVAGLWLWIGCDMLEQDVVIYPPNEPEEEQDEDEDEEEAQ